MEKKYKQTKTQGRWSVCGGGGGGVSVCQVSFSIVFTYISCKALYNFKTFNTQFINRTYLHGRESKK